MVTVVGVPAKDRDQRISKGASTLANVSVRALASHRNALLAYVAACRPRFFLKVGYRARPSKKLRNALSRWRNACCSGTLETSFSHAIFGCCLRGVSAADAS